ncbi:MAG: molybdate ABC transporter permease subunit, partial [Candidatus Acidiferrum sp.]
MPAEFLGLTGDNWTALIFSAAVSGIAVVASLPFGIAVAWLLARRSFPGKTLVETAVNLPLVLPPVVTGYLLLLTLGRHGWIGRWLDKWLGVRIAFTAAAAV